MVGGIDAVASRHGRGGGWTAAERPKKRKKRKHRKKDEQNQHDHGTDEHAEEMQQLLAGSDDTEGGPSQTGEDLLDPTPERPEGAVAVREWNASRPFEPPKHAPTLQNSGPKNHAKHTRYNPYTPAGEAPTGLVKATPAA